MQQRPGVRAGRVYDERAPADGTRVLVDRLWPAQDRTLTLLTDLLNAEPGMR